MDNISLATIYDIVMKLGPAGILLVIWYFDRKDMMKIIEDHRKEMSATLAKYDTDAKEAREMYKNNVKLVEGYELITNDFHEMMVLTIQKLTAIDGKIDQNQFCPGLRVKKESVEVVKE